MNKDYYNKLIEEEIKYLLEKKEESEEKQYAIKIYQL